MKHLPAPLQARFAGEVASLAVCWNITKGNGQVIRSTEHDRDIVITVGRFAGRYRSVANITASDVRSSSDMGVDNMEVEGAFADQWEIPDITVAEIEAGLLDNAAVEVFAVDFENPNAGQVSRRCGVLGIPARDSDGRYRVEVRGLTQRLTQNVGMTYGERCNVVTFGDVRCQFNVAAATRTGTVVGTSSRRLFTVQITAGDPPPVPHYFDSARFTFTSGANVSFTREVQRALYDVGGTLTVRTYEEFPNDIAEGDVLAMPPACNRTLEMCRDVHDNLTNFRGYGVFIPGVLAIMRGPK